MVARPSKDPAAPVRMRIERRGTHRHLETVARETSSRVVLLRDDPSKYLRGEKLCSVLAAVYGLEVSLHFQTHREMKLEKFLKSGWLSFGLQLSHDTMRIRFS